MPKKGKKKKKTRERVNHMSNVAVIHEEEHKILALKIRWQ